MQVKLLRFSSGKESTLGALLVDGTFVCFTLEDEHRDVKVPGETRIPAGTYPLRLRTTGGFHARYSARFAEFHRGMLELVGVPNFTDVLIHCGNDDRHTAGCVLVGDSARENVTTRGFLTSSESAYRRIYPPIARAVAEGAVDLTVEDYA